VLPEIGGAWLSRETFRRMCVSLHYKGKYAWLADNDLAWERAIQLYPNVPVALTMLMYRADV